MPQGTGMGQISFLHHTGLDRNGARQNHARWGEDAILGLGPPHCHS